MPSAAFSSTTRPTVTHNQTVSRLKDAIPNGLFKVGREAGFNDFVSRGIDDLVKFIDGLAHDQATIRPLQGLVLPPPWSRCR